MKCTRTYSPCLGEEFKFKFESKFTQGRTRSMGLIFAGQGHKVAARTSRTCQKQALTKSNAEKNISHFLVISCPSFFTLEFVFMAT